MIESKAQQRYTLLQVCIGVAIYAQANSTIYTAQSPSTHTTHTPAADLASVVANFLGATFASNSASSLSSAPPDLHLLVDSPILRFWNEEPSPYRPDQSQSAKDEPDFSPQIRFIRVDQVPRVSSILARRQSRLAE